MPDFVPLFLEFLSLMDEATSEKLLGEAIHVLAAIGMRLQRKDSPYANLFLLLTTLTDVVPHEQGEPPVRDMDDAIEYLQDGFSPISFRKFSNPLLHDHRLHTRIPRPP